MSWWPTHHYFWPFILLALVTGAPHSPGRSSSKADTCGYQSCNLGKPGFINVHLLPHTHDDVGWLKTVDQYYYGARNNIQKAGVQYIIDSVVSELAADPQRRFIYVETAFFWQWWLEQSEEKRNIVRSLVSSGQLEFINGGWCMNDEATTHYVDIIDQMSYGLNILNETFGECGRPRVAWQIDPFGHSREQASLFAQMGYDGLFFGRLDYEDKRLRQQTKTMEMVWTASNTLGEAGSIFTGALHNLYMNPPGFCFDIVCSDQPIIDSPTSKDYNVQERVQDFLSYCQSELGTYATENILVTMGGDFTYMDANLWYKNMDKLIKYANQLQANGSRFNLFYSTPSCYLKSLNDAGLSWPVKSDDFFPYGSGEHSYWTGYFTSRPSIKYMVRHASNLLQTCKQMESFLTLKGSSNEGKLSVLKEAMAVAQHHDAVSGTEKQHVANDYARRLHEGILECHKTIASNYKVQLPNGAQSLPDPQFCPLLNISQCATSEDNSQFVVNVYNPLPRNVDKYIRIPVRERIYEVLDPSGQAITSQLVPIPSFVQNIPGRSSAATHELVFFASQLPPLGLKSYYVRQSATSPKMFKAKKLHQRADSTISNERITVTVDETTGLIKSLTLDGNTIPLKQEFLWYAGMNGLNNEEANRASGAYIFRPNGTDAIPVTTAASVTILVGPLVQEIHQVFTSWMSQVVRVYQGQDHVELDWIVGSIPILDGVGKEIISRVTTNVANQGVFYTDSNGRQTLTRRRDHRDTWEYTINEPVSGNYYPINSHIFIKENTGNQITLITDRAQGGTSLHDGEIELMLHRRLLHDDAFGVGEALDELAFSQGLVVRGTHYLQFSTPSSASRTYRSLAQELYLQPQISFIPTASLNDWLTQFKTQYQWIKRSLPVNVNLLTLESRSEKTAVLRLEHIYDVGEDATLSQPVTVSIEDLFMDYNITSAEETMLGTNQWKKDSKRLQWSVNPDSFNEIHPLENNKHLSSKPHAIPLITLNPMDIRTFIVTFT